MYVFFTSPLDCCFQRSGFNNTLLYQNEGRGIAIRTLTFLSHSIRVPSLLPSPLPSIKTIKNLRSIKKFKHARHLHRLRALYFSGADAQNSQCSGQNTLFGVAAMKFVQETIIHHYYCMLVKSFI